MGQPRIRIYHGPESTSVLPGAPPAAGDSPGDIRVPLGEIGHLLADAVQSGRSFLADFADDQISLPGDLYDVLRAYGHYRQQM